METVEQFDNDFNVKKPKKKGLIITGLVIVIIAIAVVLVYFLVFSRPQFIFNAAIDKLFAATKTEEYDSAKIDTKIKVSIEAEDGAIQSELEELEKCALNLGLQTDIKEKQQIIDLGLEYDNESVIDARMYYDDGDVYAYFDEIYDKYIEVEMEEEVKVQIKEVVDEVFDDENTKNTQKAMEIIKDELKEQLNEVGNFENEKDTIDVGDKEEKVTKTTLKLSEKELYKLISNMCSSLAKNDKFLDCFEESPKDMLKDAAAELKDIEIYGKNSVEISIYTKGLLHKFVAADIAIYTESEDQTVTILFVEEEKDTYTYEASVKGEGKKQDVVEGKIVNKKDKDTKKEQSGKILFAIDVIEVGKLDLEMDYSIKYDDGIEEIDTKNSVKSSEITEADYKTIGENLLERPLIGELIESKMNSSGSNVVENPTINTELTTNSNEVKDYGFSVVFAVPAEFKYESDYSYDYLKRYSIGDYNTESQIDAEVTINWDTNDEYIEDIDWDFDYYTEETEYYSNVKRSEEKTITVGDKTFKYQVISYEYFGDKVENAYVWYALDEEHVFVVEIEATNTEITEDLIKGFLNITVTAEE